METKLFQDQQVAEKIAARQSAAAKKAADGVRLEKDVEKYWQEEEAAKLARKKKNTDHLSLLQSQISSKVKAGKDLQLVKTGVAIVKGDTLNPEQ